MRTIKCLIIDAADRFQVPWIILAEDWHIRVEAIAEVEKGEQYGYRLYEPDRATFQWIADQTKEHFDVVILGNNGKAGLEKAPHIPKTLRDRTIVVWTSSVGRTEPYRDLGFNRFSTRSEVHNAIRELITAV
jgi:hypothetical protein